MIMPVAVNDIDTGLNPVSRATLKDRHEQLGMNAGKASNILIKDILFDFVTKAGFKCFQCGEAMSRDNFSIEHKTPYLHSENPVELFFSLENVAYSHRKCNSDAKRAKYSSDDPVVALRKPVAGCGTNSKYTRGCRCYECKVAHAAYVRSRYDVNKRKQKYQNKGY